MTALTWSILLGLSAYRAWRLAVRDSITEPLRRPLQLWLIGEPPPAHHPLAAQPGAYGWRGRVWELFVCPWCSGSWLAFAFTATADRLVGVPVPVLVGLAAATVVGAVASRV